MQPHDPSSQGTDRQQVTQLDGDYLSGRIGSLMSLWFGMKKAVGPTEYAKCGFALMTFKYAIEAAGIWATTGARYLPWHFLNPLIGARFEMAQGAPEWLGWAWFVWTLPFLWIAITMSVRRAADAGWSPWSGFLVLVPLVNLLFMIGMCFAPTKRGDFWNQLAVDPERASAKDAVMSVGVSLVLGGLMLFCTVYVLSQYGASLFLGTPR